jgi:hypothetical protein
MMAYYEVRIEVWCDWDPKESNLEEISENVRLPRQANGWRAPELLSKR